MDIGGTIKFFGCVTDKTTCEISPAIDQGDTDLSDELKEITSYLEVDEDGSSGSTGNNGNTAPWLAVNASVPAGTGVKIRIYAIYYETSSVEHLVGDQVYSSCGSNMSLEETDRDDEVIPATNPAATPINTDWKCVTRNTDNQITASDAAMILGGVGNEGVVVYTDDEIDDNDALVVRAKSDGDEQSVNLYLSETGRFDGRYEGFSDYPTRTAMGLTMK